MDKIKLSELPERATYTRGLSDKPYVCCYVAGQIESKWTAFADISVYRDEGLRNSVERDITRAEAIAILRERGQLDEGEALADGDTFVNESIVAELREQIAGLATRLEVVEKSFGYHTETVAPFPVENNDGVEVQTVNAAPPMPPLPEVPKCGYWVDDEGKRWVLDDGKYEPVVANKTYLNPYGYVICYRHHDANSYRFVLRELIQPAAPEGYEIVGWGKPKKGEWSISPHFGVIEAGMDIDEFRWLLRPLPKVRRWEQVAKDIGIAVPLIDDGTDNGTGPHLDRERVALEWMDKWMHSHGEPLTFLDMRRRITARLAEIREGRP